jgi:hypothetical protein
MHTAGARALRKLVIFPLLPALLFVLIVMGLYVGCGGSSSTSPASISGTVAAPGGAVAFARPASPWRMFARLWDSNVRYLRGQWSTRPAGRILADVAVGDVQSVRTWWRTVSVPHLVASLLVTDLWAAETLPGVAPVAGVAVELVQLDNSGNVVQVLASGITDSSGNYTLAAPTGFNPGAKVNYAVQAVGTSTLQAFVTGTSVNVDPYTSATVSLVAGSVTQAGVSLTNLAWPAINGVQETVLQNGAAASGAMNATQMVSALTGAVNNDVELKNIVTSIAAPGSITGTITDSTGAGLANIQILVRTYGNQLTMAMTRTDSSGNYTVHVPAGNYVVGAMNDTTTSTAASQWWTSSGMTASQMQAGKVTVGTTAVTANFTLPPGGRVVGTATGGSSSTPLSGIQVTLSTFYNAVSLQWINTQPDGTYTFNVPPGSYTLDFRNQAAGSTQAYGSAWYSGTAGGSVDMSQAAKITVTAGSSQTVNMNLPAGYLISGLLADPTTNQPLSGIVVRARFMRSTPYTDNWGAFAFSMRTRVDGSYSFWVQPGKYNVLTRGQSNIFDATTGNPSPYLFNANVFTITGVIQDSNGNPVPQAMINVLGNNYTNSGGATCTASSGPTICFPTIGYEMSNGDGTFTVYADPGATTLVNGTPTTVYGGTKQAVLTVSLSDGRALSSTAYSSSGYYDYPLHGITIPSQVASGVCTPASVTAGGSCALPNPVQLPAATILTGTVTINGQAAGNRIVNLRYGGIQQRYQMVGVRTVSDGTYSIRVPAGVTIACVVSDTPGASFNFPGGVCASNSNQQSNHVTGGESLPGTPGWAIAGSVQIPAQGSQTLNFDYDLP